MRPRCSNTMSPASRRASPRSWVDITTLMPRCADGADDVLDRLGGGGIEARGRLVEEQHGGIARERARQREPLLLAAGQPPRRHDRPSCAEADQLQQFADAARVFGARHAGGAQRVADIGGRAAPQHHRPLEHDRAPRRRDVFAAAPGDAPARRREQAPSPARSSVVLPEPFGPISTVGAPAPASARCRSRIVTAPAVTRDAIEIDRQFGDGARMVIPPVVRRRGARSRPAH